LSDWTQVPGVAVKVLAPAVPMFLNVTVVAVSDVEPGTALATLPNKLIVVQLLLLVVMLSAAVDRQVVAPCPSCNRMVADDTELLVLLTVALKPPNELTAKNPRDPKDSAKETIKARRERNMRSPTSI
jgi:hypothetical protein